MSELEAEITRLWQEVAKLRMEKEILKSDGDLCEGVDVKYAWLESPIDVHPIRLTCELLGVSPSGFSAARSRVPSARAVEQAHIVSNAHREQRTS